MENGEEKSYMEKKNNDVYWRNAYSGKISCPGDDCLKECTEDCPIWCNTLAAQYFGRNDYKMAQQMLQNAVSKAPDFKDAWNNLGAVYGLQNMHDEAYNAYKNAYDSDNNYPNAIYGIAVSLKNLGKYQECLEWCDLFKQRFHDSSINEVINDCNKRMKAESNKLTDRRNSKCDKKKNDCIENDENLSLEEEYGSIIPLLLEDSTRSEGYKKIEKLFEKGYSEAGVVLGQWYSGTDREISKKYFSIPAKEDNAEALWGLSNCLPHNLIPIKGNAQDEEWVKTVIRAAQLGCPDAMNEAGNIEHRLKNYYMSAYWYGMAELYEHPQGLMGCQGIAREWVAAGRPNIPNEYQDNPMYQQAALMIRTDADDDKIQAFRNIEEATVNDDYSTLALFTAKFYGLQDKDETAIKYYEIAADRGDLFATRTLAGMLFTGMGCEEDAERGIELYRKAAERGDNISCFIIGALEKKKGNRNIANTWFAKALVRGYDNAAGEIE